MVAVTQASSAGKSTYFITSKCVSALPAEYMTTIARAPAATASAWAAKAMRTGLRGRRLRPTRPWARAASMLIPAAMAMRMTGTFMCASARRTVFECGNDAAMTMPAQTRTGSRSAARLCLSSR